jgi:hypothetical protein
LTVTDYSTSLAALARQAMDSVIDAIAKDGLVALKRVLDESGFAQSDELDGYSVAAHVLDGDVVEFEILVPVDAVERTPEVDEELLKAAKAAQKAAEDQVRRAMARSYTLDQGRPVRLGSYDARKPVNHIHDARKRAKDARLTSKGRLLRHDLALHAPRSMSLNREGKVSLRFNRSVRETSRGFEYPKRGFDGIMEKLTAKIQEVVSKNFVPELELIISRTLK